MRGQLEGSQIQMNSMRATSGPMVDCGKRGVQPLLGLRSSLWKNSLTHLKFWNLEVLASLSAFHLSRAFLLCVTSQRQSLLTDTKAGNEGEGSTTLRENASWAGTERAASRSQQGKRDSQQRCLMTQRRKVEQHMWLIRIHGIDVGTLSPSLPYRSH